MTAMTMTRIIETSWWTRRSQSNLITTKKAKDLNWFRWQIFENTYGNFSAISNRTIFNTNSVNTIA